MAADDDGAFVAGARLNLFESLAEMPQHAALRHLALPATGPLGFFSRLVIHPAHRGQGWSSRLDVSRLLQCQLNNTVRWVFALVSEARANSLVEKLQFRTVGEALVNYHTNTLPHPVKVVVKELS